MREPTIPAFSLPQLNRRVLLAQRPAAIPQAGDFELDVTDVPRAPEGAFVVRNVYLSVDPAQRGWAQSAMNYAEPVEIGTPMRALAVGVVVESRTSAIQVGHYLYGWFNWQDYCVARPEHVLSPVDPAQGPLSCHAGLLGMNGVTAYLALTSLGDPQPGERVLVSTCAGAVGSFVGQIAGILGCRTIGLTGADDKVELAVARYRYHHALNYKSCDLDRSLRELAPEGIDVFFDNTGGPILDTALRHMAVGGRVIQCGTAAISSWQPPPTGPRNEREVLTRRLSWRGFVIFDHLARWPEVKKSLAAWLAEGRIHYDEDISQGIEHAPGSIQQLYAGTNRGKKLIYIG